MKAPFVIYCLALCALLMLNTSAAQDPDRQRRAIVGVWNDCSASFDRENLLLDELNKSMHLSPPWRVVDAREPAKRAELIDKIIEEHKRRIPLLEQIRKTDR